MSRDPNLPVAAAGSATPASLAGASIPAVPSPTRKRDRSAAGKVTGRLRLAIDAMVWSGLPYQQAAQKAGMTTRALRKALERPATLAYLRAQRAALRASEVSKTLHALFRLRDQTRNANAAVSACKVLEQLEDESTAAGRSQPFSGVVI